MSNETYISLVAIVVSVVSAVFTWKSASWLKQQSTSEALIGCFNTYIQLRDKRRDAILRGNEDVIKDVYMSFVDLCWNEFRLYQCSLIPYHVFYAWMDSRYRNYKKDMGIILNNKTVSVSSVWEEMISTNYFNQHDDFLAFMSEVHDGKIKDALRIYKKPRLH